MTARRTNPFIFVFLILTIAICVSASGLKTFTKEWHIRDKQDFIMEDWPVGKNNVFPYAKCKPNLEGSHDCSLILEYFRLDGTTYKNICPLYSMFSNYYEYNMFRIRSVQNQKIAYSQYLYVTVDPFIDYQNISVINMEDCSVNLWSSMKYDLGEIRNTLVYNVPINPQVFQYENGDIEAFTYYYNNTGGARTRIINKNSDPQKVDLTDYFPSTWMDYKITMYPRLNPSEPDDYFALVQNYDYNETRPEVRYQLPEESMLKLVTTNRRGEILDQSSLNERVKLFDIDSSNGLLGVCLYKRNSSICLIECMQYNNKREQILNFSVKSVNNVSTIKLYNLQNGGLLLLTGTCDDDQICKMSEDFSLKFIQSDGRTNSAVEISKVDCPRGTYKKDASISTSLDHVTDDVYFCVNIACHISLRNSTVKLMRNCLPKNYVITPLNINLP